MFESIFSVIELVSVFFVAASIVYNEYGFEAPVRLASAPKFVYNS